MNTSRKEKAEQTDAHAQVQRLGQKCCIRMVTSNAHAPADPFARNPTTSSCLIWSSHIPSFPKLVSSSPRSLSCRLSSVFLLLSTWLFHTHLTLKATCVQQKICKAEFAETGFCKIKAPSPQNSMLIFRKDCWVGRCLEGRSSGRRSPTQH